MTVPLSTDRMPLNLRDKRAGPILDPEEAIATGIFEAKLAIVEPNGIEVEAIMQALDKSGYKIVPK
jgi:hypothetical protein